MRVLRSLDGNTQALDGGAMFGNAPRPLWSRWLAPDAVGRIPLAARSLLIRENGRNILLEAGIGAPFEPALLERYGVAGGPQPLRDALAALGLEPEDIDLVVLSHLHFDHAGGLLTPYSPERPFELLFSRAQVVVSPTQWARALAPHPRDRASYLPQLQALLAASGRLILTEDPSILGTGYRFHRSDGHTPGMLLTEVPTAQGPLLFAADLAPGLAWVHAAITMGYDRCAELIVDEKTSIFADLVARGGRLFFTHDPRYSVATLREEGGKFTAINPVVRLFEEAP